MLCAAPKADQEGGNAEPYSVSELAFALKRTIKAGYKFMRLRGKRSNVAFQGNGDVYLDLMDERASIVSDAPALVHHGDGEFTVVRSADTSCARSAAGAHCWKPSLLNPITHEAFAEALARRETNSKK